MAERPGFNRTFDCGNGVTIDLATVVAGGKESVLESLREAQSSCQARAEEIDGEAAQLREQLEYLDLELARMVARADAAKLALEAAERAFA